MTLIAEPRFRSCLLSQIVPIFSRIHHRQGRAVSSVLLLAAILTMATVGCGGGSGSGGSAGPSPGPSARSVSGSVMSGTTPIAASKVTILSAGSTQDAILGTGITNSKGAFSIPYSLSAGSDVLSLTASGRNAGGGKNRRSGWSRAWSRTSVSRLQPRRLTS